MTASQLALVLAQPHNNQQLFADHYLNVVLPSRAEWQALRDESAQVQSDIRAIFVRFTPSAIEAQTEDDLIKPVLARLGHSIEVQAALRTPRGTKKPDYIFYQDAAARSANKDLVSTPDLLRGKAFAIGDAKHWDRPLDVSLRVRSSDPDLNRVPSDQIAFYMLHSRVTWGILTNGRLWRLYHTDTAQQQDRFYEIDLEALTRHGTPEDFRYFYAFFRRAAFDDQPLGVADILRESRAAARAIGDGLRRQVYDALRHLAQGFLDYRPNQLPSDPATLKRIYDNSLTVLYRLLFVLYAEVRELLPLRESPAYRNDYSLTALAREVAERLESNRTLIPTGSRLWARLRDLFDMINDGNPPLRVATFNGGLFDPQRHPFLAQYTIGDARLARAIDLLTRIDGERIDYRDLAERHLGTIYEGLLEQHLTPLIPRDLARNTAGPRIPPAPCSHTGEQGAQNASGVAGEFSIDLVDSAGERHRTGSYYTPDFVVQYILAQTLRPTLERAVANATSDADKVAAVLAVNVCDPAMGSGHFLVAATEYIARFLLELGVVPPHPNPSPTGRGEAQRGKGESDLAFWKRRVAQSCIYGVDLNPLAVELAKLSLWLSTAAKDRPLSFLDHHLRHGNALVGARLADLRQRPQQPTSSARRAQKQAAQLAAAGQTSMLDDDAFRRSISLAVGSLWLIEASPAWTVADVKQQESTYRALREELARQHLNVADLHAALRIGLVVPPELLDSLIDYVSGKSLAALPKIVQLAEQARTLITQQQPFHWELEFPEVFFDQNGYPLGEQAGFDAVVGNPPYVRQELLAPLKPYLQAAYPETYHGVADLYVYFYQRGLELLQSGGWLSYIVTNKWMRAGYGEPLRAFFAERAIIHEIIDFGHAPIFAEADVFPCIIVLERPAPPHPNPALTGGDSFPRSPTPLPPGERGLTDPSSLAPAWERGLTDPSSLRLGVGEGGQGDAGHHVASPLAPAWERGLGGEGETMPDTVRVTIFPREALGTTTLAAYVETNSQQAPRSRFGRSAWSLEASDVDALMEKLRRVGVPLAEFAGVKPYYGIKTGLNEAFLIDTPTKERLVREDPRSAEIIKPYLRGQDIKRWSPEWDGMSIILLKSSGNFDWPWSSHPNDAETIFAQQYPSIFSFIKPLESKLRDRQDKGKYWWELRACGYYEAFAISKIMYQVIQFHPQYGIDTTSALTNDKGFFLPIADSWIISVLNSPLMWWHNWRYLPHMKDEALNPAGVLMEKLPIAPPTDDQRAEVEPAIQRLIVITQADQQARRDTIDWLRTEFGIATPGQKLEAFSTLDEQAFIEEVRKRRAKSLGKLTPAGLRALRDGYREQAQPIQERRREALGLERRLAAIVNAAYGLTQEEIDLLWRTAPPRMPVGRGEGDDKP